MSPCTSGSAVHLSITVALMSTRDRLRLSSGSVMNDQVGVDESIRDKAGDYAGEPSDLCSYIVTWNMNSRILLALPEILQGLCRLMPDRRRCRLRRGSTPVFRFSCRRAYGPSIELKHVSTKCSDAASNCESVQSVLVGWRSLGRFRTAWRVSGIKRSCYKSIR